MAPPYVGGAHGHNVISIVSVIKEEHVRTRLIPKVLDFAPHAY